MATQLNSFGSFSRSAVSPSQINQWVRNVQSTMRNSGVKLKAVPMDREYTKITKTKVDCNGVQTCGEMAYGFVCLQTGIVYEARGWDRPSSRMQGHI